MAYPLHRDGKNVPASPNLPALEEEVLAYWEQDGTFQASIDQRPAGINGDNEFVFYDGPPFANGLPHYGHLLTGYAKDVVPRYQTMRGRRVERRFGWDTHGLPAELEAERILGITDKSQIEDIGIAKFNETCKTAVLKYTKEWEEYVTRQARWVDFENDYKTLDVTFMESVIWAFKTLYDKGLAYEGFRVLPYCWRDETPLSNHELRMDDDVYQMRQDPALTVLLPLRDDALRSANNLNEGQRAVLLGASVVVWTTTPWTLPSNLAVAVGPEVEYAVVVPENGDFAGQKLVLAVARLGTYARELGEEPQVLATVPGAALVGLTYEPPLPYFRGADNAHQIAAGDFVTTDNGTGLVHLAPYGEDDLVVLNQLGIAPVEAVDAKGQFTALVPDYAGVQVFDANAQIIKDLKAANLVLRHETYDHSYPHCWRCRNPLIYKPVSSWFVRVTEFRDEMVELNEEITWTPEHIKHGQFGKWLAGARDWSISRNRYFGTPIPVWVSDNPEFPRVDVYGSLAELETDFGRLPLDENGEPNLHRPYIDELTRPNPDDPTGQSTMRRITDVLDVWFDSGSMPFAQVHYPFENQEWFDNHYPGDFIVEYIGQTRGWFYVMHALATALFGRPAFRNCVSHGIVLGSDGRKMSKSLRNYPDVSEVLDRDGSDAMRWFLMSSPILRGGNLVVTEEGIRDSVRQVLLPLWSTYYFFTLYAGSANGGDGYQAKQLTADRIADLPVLDRYLLARTRDLVAQLTEQMDRFDIAGACEAVRDHIDLLTNWYVRTQRDRFWEEDADAFDTLYTALEVLARLVAPLAPLLAEEIWRGLTGERSVHLTQWPSVAEGRAEADILVADDALVDSMDLVREVTTNAHALRKAAQQRVRQPLQSMSVAVPDSARLAPYTALLASELNVKAVELLDFTEQAAAELGVSQSLNVNARAAGPRLGKAVQQVIRAAKAGDWEAGPEGVVVQTPDGPVALEGAEYELVTVVSGDDDGGPAKRTASVLGSGGVVLLNLELTEELLAEGYARDTIRAVQDARKAAGFEVSDRISLALQVPADKVSWLEANRELLGAETLALEVSIEAAEVEKPEVSVTKLQK